MKRIYPIFLIIFLLFSYSCSRNYPFAKKTFYGDRPGITIPSLGDADELSISFEGTRMIINAESYPFEVIEENDEYILLRVDTEATEEEDHLSFRYLITTGDLILIDNENGTTLRLMTQDRIFENKLNSFSSVPLSSDISHLSENQKEMLRILFKAADIMNDLFWIEAYGDKSQLMETTENEYLKSLFRINYGPWERLNNDKPFLPRYGVKSPGANFYPSDMTVEEFEAFEDPAKTSLYTLIRREENGNLKTIWYHEAFSEKLKEASDLIMKASELAEDEGFKTYLKKRAAALLNDDYYESDVAWMKMKNNAVDFVVGPIENYEDKLFNYKAAHESFLLIKDLKWSKKLARLTELLPMLQRELPVSEEFKQESPGTSSDLNVYDVVYYAGDCNAGSKTIAINLPNDPEVRQNYGSRKLQLKNSIRYKFENILVPISNVLISEDQRQFVDFDAFFENTMFHEVAHGLGVDYTINGKGPVRQALKEAYSAIEEGKADILGLYIVTKLGEMGELGEKDLMTNYVTFMAGIFRSVRFGAASAHGKANMIRFYYFQEKGAFSRDDETGTYSIDFERMKNAMEDLTLDIITMQGMGDYNKASRLLVEKGKIGKQLQNDLNRLNTLNIPVDLVFEQGPEELGL